MTIRSLFLFCIVALPLKLWSQPPTTQEPSPKGFILLEKEPAPINLEELKQLIGYPQAAMEAKIQGKVIIRILIDEQGNYSEHIVLQDPNPILTEAVSSKIPNIRFTPGIQNGKPIRVWVTVPFDFVFIDDGLAVPNPTTIFFSLEEALACPNPAQVQHLFILGNQLKFFPMEVLKFVNLKVMDLGDNQLTILPSEFVKLKQLTYLGLSANQFTEFPDMIQMMPNLQSINVKGNQFSKATQKAMVKEFGDRLFPKDDKGKVVW